MEEEKFANTSQFHNISDDFELALWQWQFDLDPWKEKDPAKWTWRNYTDEDCRIIEKAFSQNKEVADLNKDYEIDLKKMLQVRKDDRHRIRRVRRQKNSRLAMEISKPVAIVQKTMNEAFGTIQQFLDYIMKRTPEAYALCQRLKGLPLDTKNTEFEDIIQEVIHCIERGAEMREKTKKKSGNSKGACFIQGKDIVNAITNNSKTLGGFFEAILKIYTMETFVYLWLNELLRSEDWEEINVLTPYLVCLVYTFKLSTYIMKHQGPQGFVSTLLGFFAKQKLYLFRGAALTKEDLVFYDEKKVKYFSWNGVTSTSRKKKVAQGFLKAPPGKCQVIFIIETDFTSPEDCEGMIEITRYSDYPEEEEIILAPGTVFKLQKTHLIEKDYYEISLKVVKKFEETIESQAFLGALQDQAISKDKAVIDGLPSLKNMRLLHLLKGNKLIKKLEIRNSGIEENLIEDLENMRTTTKVKKQDVKLIDNTIVVSGLSILAEYFLPENLNNIILSNKIRFQKIAVKTEEKKKWKTSVILREEALKKLQKDGLLQSLWENIKQDKKATTLEVSMMNIQIESSEFRDFLESVGDMKHLESLILRINSKNVETTEDLTHFCGKIESLTALKQLSIELALSDRGSILFSKVLESLTSLQHLNLDFKACKQISDKGLEDLKTALVSLKSLKHLSISLKNCDKISDKGLDGLKMALEFLTSLQHLNLDFKSCKQISDTGLGALKTALEFLTSLQHLSLDFKSCKQISDRGLEDLKTALVSLKSLKHLSINLENCDKISDKGLGALKTALEFLTSLQHLNLDFKSCKQISDQGLEDLKTALLSLKSLKHLSINLENCDKISDEGLSALKTALEFLTSLQRLSLNFTDCIKISDVGFHRLHSSIGSLEFLQYLSLEFNFCNGVTNKGLSHLKNSLLSLTSLKHLSLDFTRCNRISDEGLNELHLGLVSLKSLQYLSLNFAKCFKISNKGLSHLTTAILSLKSLQNLYLDFTKYEKISDEGIKHLNMGLQTLQNLSLKFKDCERITDAGLSHLQSFLGSLSSSLQHLSIDLTRVVNISSQGLNDLLVGLMKLKSLKNLSLNFGWLNELSNDVLNNLKITLSSLVKLEYLTFDFRWCDNVTDEGIKLLAASLASLVLLENLALNFGACEQVSDEGLKSLKNVLILLTNLRHLSLDFSGCVKVTDEATNHLKDELKLIPYLECHKSDFI